MKHTPTPWSIYTTRYSNRWRVAWHIVTKGKFLVIAQDGLPRKQRSRLIATITAWFSKDREDELNALRIVDCVNACEGMEDPSADIAHLRKEVDRLNFLLRLRANDPEPAPEEAIELIQPQKYHQGFQRFFCEGQKDKCPNTMCHYPSCLNHPIR
jgi:hypothetical protein